MHYSQITTIQTVVSNYVHLTSHILTENILVCKNI